MLHLTVRPAMLGPSLNPRRELHGEEPVPACDLPLDGVMLSGLELGELLDDDQAASSLFVDGEDGLKQPAFPQLKPLVLKDKFEGARVVLVFRDEARPIQLVGCKVGSVTLTPQAGGMTKLKLQVQAHPSVEQLGVLYEHMGSECTVLLDNAKPAEKAADERQGELPMAAAEVAAVAAPKVGLGAPPLSLNGLQPA